MKSFRAVLAVLSIGILGGCAGGDRQSAGDAHAHGERLGEVRFDVSCMADAKQKFRRAMAEAGWSVRRNLTYAAETPITSNG
jgi:hypothetical protein